MWFKLKTSIYKVFKELSPLPMSLNPPTIATTQNLAIQDFSVLNNSDVFIINWSFDEKTKQQNFSYVSESIQYYGYPQRELLENKLQWTDIIHPEDIQKVLKAFQQAIRADKGEYTITYRLMSFDSYCWIQDNATFYRDKEDQTVHVQSIMVNVSHSKAIEAELEQKNNYLNLLHETAISLGERQDLAKTLDTILRQLKQITKNSDTYIALKNDDETLSLVAATGIFKPLINNATFNKSFGAMGEIWQTGQPLYIEDYKNYPKRAEAAYAKDIISIAGFPLTINGEFLGVLGFTSSSQIIFTDSTKTLYLRFVQLTTLALDNSQILQAINTKLKKQKELEEQLRAEQASLAQQVQFRINLSDLIEKSLSNNQHFGDSSFYEMILESAMQSLAGAEAGSLLVRQNDDQFHFVSAISYNLTELQSVILQEEELHFDAHCTQAVLQYHIDNSKLDEGKQEHLNQKLNELQVTLSVPIHIHHQLVALINIDNFSNREAFTKETTQLAQVFSRHIAVLWRRFRLEKEIQEREVEYRDLFDEATQKTNELSLLSELQHAISRQLELTELFKVSLQKISEIFGYSFSYIRVLEGEHLNLVANHGFETSLLPPQVSRKNPITKTLLDKRELFYLNSENYEEYIGDKEKMFGSSTMLLPILVKETFWGFMGIGHSTEVLNQQDFDLGHKVVELMSVAIENAQLHAHVKHDLRRNEYLHNISQEVQDHDDLNKLMNNIVEQVRQAMSARWAMMYKIDVEQKRIKRVSTTNLDNSPLKILSYEELINGLGGWAIRNKKAAFTPKGVIDERQSPEFSKRAIDIQLGSVAVIPFTHNGKVEGIFSIINHMDDPDFSENDLQLLGTVANQVGAAIAKHKLIRQIEHQAFHDSLTGLPNRLQFEKEISSIVNMAQRRKTQFAVLFIDLDGFKHINDTLGHALGDELLIGVGNRIQKRKRSEDILARMGGDEFAIVLNGVSSREDALKIANDYLKFFLEPYAIAGYELNIGASIGVSLYPEDGNAIATLLSNADSAMYQAKNAGKNSVSGFTQSLAEEVKERAKLERELKLAIERGELELHYQPQYNINTQETETNEKFSEEISREIIGLEALVRWRHPEKGMISPGIFIPIAEESNLIVDLGNWVLFEACRQNAEWQAQGHPALRVAVNISAKQFVKEDFVETVIEALKKNRLQSEFLELEVTESIIMNDVKAVIERLKLLRKLKINIAIDDFGTGYSSLTYLQDLPLDKLKIDKSFVDKLEENVNPAIIKTILTLAQSLGLTTIAEGVETKKQVQILKDLGCDEIQGFYFSKPLPKEDVFKDLSIVQYIANEDKTKNTLENIVVKR